MRRLQVQVLPGVLTMILISDQVRPFGDPTDQTIGKFWMATSEASEFSDFYLKKDGTFQYWHDNLNKKNTIYFNSYREMISILKKHHKVYKMNNTVHEGHEWMHALRLTSDLIRT